jgi:hypothetical protein
MTMWALLLLPLVAVGVAVALMLSWGSSQGAQAAGPDPAINMYVTTANGSCDTNPSTVAGAKCSASVGSSFTLTVQLDKLAGLTDADGDMKAGWTFVQWHQQNNAVLTFNDLDGAGVAEAKNCAPGNPAETGGNGDYGITCNLASGQNERTVTGNMFTLNYTCTTQGTGTVTQLNGGALDTSLGDENFAGIPAAPGAGTSLVLTVNCTPPDRVIEINKTDDVTGAFVGPTCWQVFALLTTFPNGPLSPPVLVNQPLDVVGDNGKVCAGSIGIGTDSNAALGQIDITISGALRAQLGTDEWHVLETQAPPKYAIGTQGNTKQVCILTSANCVVNVTDPRTLGNINVSYNDTVTGQPLAGQCVNVHSDPPTNLVLVAGSPFCGAIASQPLGDYSVELVAANVPVDRQVKAPTKVVCSLTALTPKCTVKFNFNPTIPFNLKAPTLANLFLTAQGSKLPPSTCASSTNVQTFSHLLSNAPVSADPKDPTETQQVGGFEMNVLFNEDLICVNLTAGAYFTGTAGSVCFIDDKDQGLQPDGLARIGCVIKGKPAVVSSSLELARITVRPQPELYSLITADQDNGVNAQILNSGCNLADMQGHPIKKIGCDDSEVTIRFLEGDVNGDCAVNVADQQLLAFRWGAKIGSSLYNPRFDLEPSGQINSDGDIDIKDVQFVFGRHSSVCVKSGTGPLIWPPQPPRNEKLTNP